MPKSLQPNKKCRDKELTSKSVENLQQRLGILTRRQTDSSLKGKDNEDMFEKLLCLSLKRNWFDVEEQRRRGYV